MKPTQKTFVVIVITLICAAGSAQAGMLGDPHAIGMGSTAWLTGPSGYDVGDGPNTVRFTTDGATSGNAADILLLEQGSGRSAQITQRLLGSTGSDRYRTVSDLLGETESGGIDPGVIDPIRMRDRLSNGSGGADVPDWFALDRGRLNRRRRHFTGGDQPDDPTNPVPEPATVMLLATGLLVIGTYRVLSSRGEMSGESVE